MEQQGRQRDRVTRTFEVDRVVDADVLEPPEVHVAAGMIAAREGIGVTEAIAWLRRRAASVRRSLSTVAFDVIDRRI